MRALRLLAPGKLELAELRDPAPAPGWVLIRTGATTICTSDLQDIRGGDGPMALTLPVTLGHEGAGIVEAVGEGVTGVAPGDRVAAHPVHPCGVCAECRRGLAHLCPHLSHFGIDLQGTFADRFLARVDRVRRVPHGVDLATAALAEPVCCCLEAVARADAGPGQSLAILGDGFFGITMARLAARAPGPRVVIAGHHDFRLGFATGATPVNLRAAADPEAALLEANGGPYDAVIVAVPRPESVRLGLRLLRPRGRLALFAPIGGETPLDLNLILMRELELRGAVNDEDRFDEAVALLADPALDLAGLITQRLPLADWEQALALAERGRDEAIKVAFTWETEGAA